MMIDTITMGNGSCSSIVSKRGVVVGWTRVPSNNPLPNPTVYHVLVRPDHYHSTAKYQNPIIKAMWEGRYGMLELFFLLLVVNNFFQRNVILRF